MVDVMVGMFNVDPTLSGKELSSRLGLSVSRLARVFKRQMGVSIVEYRNRLRFERFFELLAGERGRKPTLRQAARAAGFGSYAHFHRLFRARWQTGPREGLPKRGRGDAPGAWNQLRRHRRAFVRSSCREKSACRHKRSRCGWSVANGEWLRACTDRPRRLTKSLE